MASSSDFQALPGPLGISQAFINQQPTTLVMKEKFSFSGDDFTIQTIQGQDVIRVNGKAVSMSGRKESVPDELAEFYTPAGQHLFTLRKEHFSFPKSWYLETPNGEKFLFIQGRFSIGKAKMDVKFKNMVAGGADVTLEIRGQFFDRSADITWDGKPVAKIRREFFNMSEIFGNKQTYGVEIAPGVDVAMMAACVIAVDEQRNEK